jgi:hypothetical protein
VKRTALLLTVAIVIPACHQPKATTLISWPQYSRRSYRWPYVLQLTTPHSALMYFGAQHTNDPRDPQLVALQRLWDEFRPDVALNEGGDPPVARTRDDAAEQYGETGLLRWLAARDGVAASNMDLPRELQAKSLLAEWPPANVKMFFLVRALLPCERRPDCERTIEIQRILPIISSTTGIKTEPNTLAEYEQALAHLPPSTEEVLHNHTAWFDPTRSGYPFNEMARKIVDSRDEAMILAVVQALRGGHRVFAVAGGSHVVREEPIIRAAMDKAHASQRNKPGQN